MNVTEIVNLLSPREIARTVGAPFDEAYNAYRIRANRCATYAEFEAVFGEFYNHVFTRCVASGTLLPPYAAAQRAREILEHEHRRDGGIVAAFNEAHDATRGGVRFLLGQLLEAMKGEATRHYMQAVFDRYVAPNAWPDKVEVIRQLMARCGPDLAPTLDRSTPERYAHDFATFAATYTQGIEAIARSLRRY